MRQKIISILMVIAILMTTVDITVFASEATVSGGDLQSWEKEEEEDKSVRDSLSGNEVECNLESIENVSGNDIKEGIEDIGKTVSEYEVAGTVSDNAMINKSVLETITGQCGENLTWTLDGEVLRISGTGDMWDYGYDNKGGEEAPWRIYEEQFTQLILEEGITSIGDNAFRACFGLKGELVIPDTVNSIGDSAFACCYYFDKLILSKNLKIIGNNAFGVCFGLKGELIIPEGVERIGWGAFEICTGLSGNLTIPSSVKVIDMTAFSGCENIGDTIYIKSKDIILSDLVFSGTGITTVYGAKGTDAEAYATRHGLKFVEYDAVSKGEKVFFNGHTYQMFYTSNLTWKQMQEYCKDNNGYLASIASEEENQFLYNYMLSCGMDVAYIGLSEKEEGQWQWTNGEYTDYINWADGEPNNLGGNENYVCFMKKHNGKWNDGHGTESAGYICEWDEGLGINTNIDYDLYSIEIYSEFSNCNIGVGQTMALIPAMVKDGEALKGENAWNFQIENDNIAIIQEYISTEFGPAIRIEGKNIGSTELNVLHTLTGRSKKIIINVVDTMDYFNVTWLEKLEINNGIYNAGIYMEGFEATRNGNGYDISFTVYNGINTYGAVEVYNANGELIEVERIDKFESFQTGLSEVVSDVCNLVYTSFNGTIDSYKNKMYSEETKIEKVWVPDDGYMVISNNLSKSIGTHIYNMVDLSIWAFSVGKDVEKALTASKNTEVIIKNTSKNVVKQYIEAVKSEIITDATKGKYQEKLYKALDKKVTKDLMTDLAGELITDSNAFFEEMDIDLWEEATEVSVSYGDEVLVEAFKRLGGPAGVVLAGIFKTSEYLNRFMQLAQIVIMKDAKEIKIYADGSSDKLVSNDVIVENAAGQPIVNNVLIVNDLSEEEHVQYILEDFKNESQIKILDITMYRDDEEVQPEGKIRVKIPIPEQFDPDKCMVYRAEEDGTFTNMEAYYLDGFMIFETQHLSKYLLVETFEYSIVFNGNGANEGAMVSLENLKKDTEYSIPQNGFEKEGYVFVNWNTQKDGSGISYRDGAIIKNLAKENGDVITLYAQWEKIEFDNWREEEEKEEDNLIQGSIDMQFQMNKKQEIFVVEGKIEEIKKVGIEEKFDLVQNKNGNIKEMVDAEEENKIFYDNDISDISEEKKDNTSSKSYNELETENKLNKNILCIISLVIIIVSVCFIQWIRKRK